MNELDGNLGKKKHTKRCYGVSASERFGGQGRREREREREREDASWRCARRRGGGER